VSQTLRAQTFDVAVVGQGLIGLATTLALARRGVRVVALDSLGSGHPATSSTGVSRSIRVAYAAPEYVRLALAALEAWARLELDEGATILHLTGQVDLGPDSTLDALQQTMAGEGVEPFRCDAGEVQRLIPELRLDPGEHALYHRQGGTVLARAGLDAMAAAATRHGAELAAPERVVGVEKVGDGVRVTTGRRRIDAGVAVIATGPWANELLIPLGLGLPLAPAVAQVSFFDTPGLISKPGIAEWSVDADGRGVYGHPVPGVGYKFAFDAAGREPWLSSTTEWPPDAEEQRVLVEWVERRFPGVSAPVLRSERHPWTMTPDSDFVIDRDGALVVACGCSGHAFKFGPALGELVADIAQGAPRDEAPLFSLRRSALASAPAEAWAPIAR
jgi:sarcosine oxidase